MKKTTIMAAVAAFVLSANVQANDANINLYPADAKAGECYANITTPAKFETTTKQVEVSAASTKIKVIPAQYKTVTEKVLVSEAGFNYVNVPATYKMVSEREMVKPAYSKWETKNGVSCKVEVPASYRVTQKRVVDKPAHVNKVEIPAKYKTIQKRVVAQEAKTVETQIPAKYKNITTTNKVSNESSSWSRVLCERNLTTTNVSAIQKSLKAKGFYKGPIDGIIGSQTLNASSRYAKKNGMAFGPSYISMDVVKSLGITTM